MSRTIIVLFFLLPFTGFSQNFIGKSKAQVRKKLQEQIEKNDNLSILLTEKESELVFTIKPVKVLPAEFIYGFDKNGKCQSEKITAYCDSCFNKFLQDVLEQKRFDWKKINENQYVSKYRAQMMIELPAENNDFSYTILKTAWTKKLYKMLIGN